MTSRFDRIKRLREEIQARDYEGVTPQVLTGDIVETLLLAREQQKLLKVALQKGIDDEWKARARALVDHDW